MPSRVTTPNAWPALQLHIDPEAAQALGFPRPILHGLCTLGIVARRLQAEYSGHGRLRLSTLKVGRATPDKTTAVHQALDCSCP
jgi:MaoC like domain